MYYLLDTQINAADFPCRHTRVSDPKAARREPLVASTFAWKVYSSLLHDRNSIRFQWQKVCISISWLFTHGDTQERLSSISGQERQDILYYVTK